MASGYLAVPQSPGTGDLYTVTHIPYADTESADSLSFPKKKRKQPDADIFHFHPTTYACSPDDGLHGILSID